MYKITKKLHEISISKIYQKFDKNLTILHKKPQNRKIIRFDKKLTILNMNNL